MVTLVLGSEHVFTIAMTLTIRRRGSLPLGVIFNTFVFSCETYHISYHIFSLSSTTRGTSQHDNVPRRHIYNMDAPQMMPKVPGPPDDEFVKSARLLVDRHGITHDRTLRRYKIAWMALYPSEEVPLTSEGLPIDFLWDPRHTCPRIPWIGDIPASESLSGNY